MTTSNLDSPKLKGAVLDGWIHESVLNQIFNISPVDRPLIDMIGSDMVGNTYTSWLADVLRAPDKDNAVVDGSDASTDASAVGTREGNHSQIAEETIAVSTTARESDAIGQGDALAYQVEKTMKALWTDTEASVTSDNASVAATEAVAGKCAGLEAWLVTNTLRGALGADGGFGTTTADIVDASTPGTAIALSESGLKDMMESVFAQGGETNALIMRFPVKRIISEYFYTDQAKTAIMQAEVGQDSGADVAKGNVELWVSDWGTVALVPSRSQPTTATDTSTVFLVDPDGLRMGYVYNMRAEPLGKLGLSDRKQMSHEFTLKVLEERGQGLVADVLETAAMLAVPA